MQSPDQLTKEMIEDYLLYLKKEKQYALTTVGSAITGLRFFYNQVVGNEQLAAFLFVLYVEFAKPTDHYILT
jgi:hypothetical protein